MIFACSRTAARCATWSSASTVFKLLGGRTKEKIPCYYSKLYRTDLADMQAEAEKDLKQGFAVFKTRFGYGPAHGTHRVGNELFYDIFDGEPVAEQGFLQLDDEKPGLGLTLKTEFLQDFKIIE